MRVSVAGALALGAALLAVPAWASLPLSAGMPDPTFGVAGYVHTLIEGSDTPQGVLVQRDGRVVVAGQAAAVQRDSTSLAVARYLPDGSTDTSFGRNGVVTVEAPTYAAARVVLQTADGGLLVLGDTFSVDGHLLVQVRLTPDGVLDRRFGQGGLVTTLVRRGMNVFAAALAPDGRVVVTGQGTDDHYPMVTVRLLPGGALDPRFGRGGVVTTKIKERRAADGGQAVVVQPDGRVVVAGLGSGTWPAVVRYLPNGALDRSFGTRGKVIVDALNGFASGLVLDGRRLVLTGVDYGRGGTADHGFVVALGLDGRPDRTFAGGRPLLVSGAVAYRLQRLAVTPTHGYVAVGHVQDMLLRVDLLAVRLRHDGTLDAAFGDGGVSRLDAGLDEAATAVALQPDGRVLVTAQQGGPDQRVTHWLTVRLLG